MDPLYLFGQPEPFNKKEKERRDAVKKTVQNVSLQLIYDNPINAESLKAAAQTINQDHYSGVVEERSINKMCGYPLCTNELPKLSVVEQKRTYRICPKQNALYRVERLRLFCSGECFAASEFFRKQLSDESIYCMSTVNEPQLLSTRPRRRQTLGDEIISRRRLFQQCLGCPEEGEPGSEELDEYIREMKAIQRDHEEAVSKDIKENRPVQEIVRKWITTDTRNWLHKSRTPTVEYELKVHQFLGSPYNKVNHLDSEANEWRRHYLITNVIRSIAKSHKKADLKTIGGQLQMLVKTFDLTNTNVIMSRQEHWNDVASILMKILIHFDHVDAEIGTFPVDQQVWEDIMNSLKNQQES